MTTSSIGSAGRDYSTINLWSADCPPDLVAIADNWIGECYNDSIFAPCSIGGVTTSPSYTKKLVAAAGESIADDPENPLRYDPTKGVVVRSATKYISPIIWGCFNGLIERLQLAIDPIAQYGAGVEGLRYTKVSRCLIQIEGTTGGRALWSEGLAVTLENCALIATAPIDYFALARYDQLRWQYLTMVCLSGVVANGLQFYNSSEATSGATNVASFGVTTPVKVPTNNANAAYCKNGATDQASMAAGVPYVTETDTIPNLVFADQFKDISLATLDLRPKAGSALLNAGIPIVGVDVDFYGTLRSLVSPSIGCVESSGGSAPTFDQGLNFRGSVSWATDVDPDCFMRSPGAEDGVKFAYPWTTPQNNVCGWFRDTSQNTFEFLEARDTTRYGPELSGVIATRNGRRHDFQMDLTSPGEYDIRVALGSVDGAAGVVFVLRDDATVLFQQQTLSPGAGVYDAMGTFFAGADWGAGNMPRRVSFATTKLVLELGAEGFYDYGGTMAHLSVTQVSGGVEPPETTGGIGATESKDATAFSGSNSKTGTIAATEARDTTAFAGSMIPSLRTGTVGATEAKDTARFTGDSQAPAGNTGAILANEAKDTTAFSGANSKTGTINANEARDTAALAGTLIPSFRTGTLASTEAKDTTSIAGSVSDPNSRSGGLASTEARDTAAFSGAKTFVGTIGATERRDTALIQGLARTLVSGTLAATESRDRAAFTDEIEEDGVANTIALRDGNTGLGVSPEDSWDSGAPRGNDGVNLPTALGQAAAPNNFQNTAGAQRQARLVLAPADTVAGTDVIPGFYSGVDVKADQWVWCMARTAIAADNDNPLGQGNTTPVGFSATTLGNPAPPPPVVTVTMEDPPDIYAFTGTVVHPPGE